MATTRQELLDAGVGLYATMSAELLKGLTAGAVAEAAGFHRQTFYRYWSTQSEYVQDLMRHVLGTDRSPVADGVKVLSAPTPPTDLEEFARHLSRHDISRVLEDPQVMMRVGLLVMDALDRPALTELSQQFYDATIGSLAEGYTDALAGMGRTPVGETTPRDLARMVQGLMLGLVLQAKAAEDDPGAEVLLERATLAILAGLTEPTEGGEQAGAPPIEAAAG